MADLLPEEKRAEGFGVIRMMFNLAVTFGPLLGGLLAGISYVLLFSVDAATSIDHCRDPAGLSCVRRARSLSRAKHRAANRSCKHSGDTGRYCMTACSSRLC